MKKKTVSGIMLTLPLIGMLTLAFNVQPVRGSGTIYIRPDGSVEGTDKIQRDEDVYTFTDNIYDRIVIEIDNIVVDGASYTLQGTGNGTGITLSGRSNVTIKNTEIKAWIFGIWLAGSSNNSISGNNITNNQDGITLVSSNYNSIFGNNITANNADGIWLDGSSNNTISGNTIDGFNRTIYVDTYIRYDTTGIALGGSYSSNNTIFGNKMTNNYYCVRLSYTNNNTVSGNNITNNEIGIGLLGSSNNTVSGNNITNNQDGIGLFHSSNYNSIFGNDITNNEYGIRIDGFSVIRCSNNTIYHNNFIDNREHQAICGEDSTNTWDNGAEGNYWSDYTGEDQNGDGIGDTPYVIDENNKDNHPLMNPWNPSWSAKIPLWSQWWFWTIVVAGIVVLAGAVYFLKKRKPLTQTVPPIPLEDTA